MKNSIKHPSLLLTLMVLFFALMTSNSYALPEGESAKTETDSTVADTTKKETKEIKETNQDGETVVHVKITETTIQIISVLFFVVMLILFYFFFKHIKTTNHHQYLGFQSIKLIGLILMFPGICILALVGNGLLSGGTLAALLGTIAGYVLSREDDSSKDSLKKEKDDLKKKTQELEAEIKSLKAQLPAPPPVPPVAPVPPANP